MLKTLTVAQANFIALLARTARAQRDAELRHVPETDLADTKGARGEHNPTRELGFEPAGTDDLQLQALHDAVAELAPEARAELWILMRIGQGDLAAEKWHHGVVDAARLGDAVVTAALVEDADLHAHLAKGLYQAGLGA